MFDGFIATKMEIHENSEKEKNTKKAFHVKKKKPKPRTPPDLTNQERREVFSTYLIAT